MGGERAPKELRHAVRAGNLEIVKKHVVGGKYKDAISNPKVGSTLLFASAQVRSSANLALAPAFWSQCFGSNRGCCADLCARVSKQRGHAKVAKHLIDGGADVNTNIKSGASALYTACFRVRNPKAPIPNRLGDSSSSSPFPALGTMPSPPRRA